MRFAEVAVDAPAGHDRTFSYSIPPSLELGPGFLVMVPFGPQRLQGIIFSLSPSPKVPETRDVLSVSSAAPVLADSQLELAQWMSRYYMCTLFEAAALMLPPGGRLRQRTYLSLNTDSETSDSSVATDVQLKVLDYLKGRDRAEEDRVLAAVGRGARAAISGLVKDGLVTRFQGRGTPAVGPKYADYVRLGPLAAELPPGRVPALGRRAPRQEALVERLLRDDAPMAVAEARREYGRGAVDGLLTKGWIELRTDSDDRGGYVALPPPATELAPDEVPPLGSHNARQEALLERLLADDTPIALSDARKESGTSAVNALLQTGWLQKEAVSVDRDPLAGREFELRQPVVLTPAQQAAAAEVRAALDEVTAPPSAVPQTGPATSQRGFLLEGVTGSGKTEVYLDAVQHCLDLGRRAIVTVPEISLAPQTIERFVSRFPGQVAVLHSGLSPGERFDQWWKVHRGEYGIVIGSRSAVFAPQPDLALIVIDEEHEWTYKQHDAGPRYHTRDVALRLARQVGAAVVMGSASPDVATYHGALAGRVRLLRLPDRVPDNGRSRSADAPTSGLATAEIVDMRAELRDGNREIFSRSLLSSLDDCVQSGSQAVLFLNRRGSASYMQCRNCGFGIKCSRCDIPMTYHKDGDRLLCHYCGARRGPPAQCPNCKEFKMSFYGVGTQTVAEEVERHFPGVGVLRWDRDSTKKQADYEGLLDRFRSGEAQVLVGTQMIAKGLHFPSVTLAGVVSADVGLYVPDYRAGERAFQLLLQVAGRAGRGQEPGKAIIQTYQPDNYAIRAATTQDFPGFYREEIEYRRQQGSPPFNRLIRMLYSHTNRAICEREAYRVSEHLRRERDSWGYSDVDLLGPMPAYPARIRGHYRWQLILRAPNPRVLLDKLTMPQGWTVDVDPVGLG